MSVRTYDPKEAQIFPPALCSAGCGKPYYSICKFCNLAYCFDHLKTQPHACDTKGEYIVPTHEEFHELHGPADLEVVELSAELPHPKEVYTGFCCLRPGDWDSSPKGCFAQHPQSNEICQLPVDGHTVHKREHPNKTELVCWVSVNGKAANGEVHESR